VAVEPVELDGVAAHGVGAGRFDGRGVHGQKLGWPGFELTGLAAFRFPLLDAGGAGAGLAQPGKVPGAAVAVCPVDLKPPALSEQNTNLLRSDGDAGERLVVLVLACLLAFVYNAYAFVAHKDSLQFAVDSS